MKKILKIIFRVLLVIALIFLSMFAIQGINSYRYREYENTEDDIYSDPADLSLYPTEIDGMKVETIEEGLLNGFHLVPDKVEKNGVVVTFGGSEGSTNYEIAQELAAEGYEVYSLFYFGPGDLPDELIEVPLELFESFLDYHEKNSQTAGPITVLGTSKGAELTLNLAVRYNEIDQIVLYAPTAYNFFSLDQENADRSSWTYQQQMVPYLSNQEGDLGETLKMIGSFLVHAPVEYEPVYTGIIEEASDSDLEAARIEIEDFEGEGLIFAGGDDLMWSSISMAEKIEEYSDQIEVHTYSKAGHVFTLPPYLKTEEAILAFGGTEEANQKAAEKSSQILLEKLSEWHK